MRDVYRARNGFQGSVVATDTAGGTWPDAPRPRGRHFTSIMDKAAAAIRSLRGFLSTDQQWGAFVALILFLKFCLLLVDASLTFSLCDYGRYLVTSTSVT